MLPQIKFVYNKEYDGIYRDFWYLSDKTGAQYQSDEINIKEYFDNNIQPLRNTYGNSILKKIKEIGIYEWTENIIPIYIIGSANGMRGATAIPITIGCQIKNKKYILDLIVHELIHYYLISGGQNIKEYYKYMSKLYNLENYHDDSHFLLYSMQYYIYQDIPEIREYVKSRTLKGSYSTYISKAQEIGFDKIIKNYQDFIISTEQEIYKNNYPLLRFKVAGSYDRVFSNLLKMCNQNKYNEINQLGYINSIQNFINREINIKYRKLYQIPKIICKITEIKSEHKFFYINLVSYDPYNINIPMTIGLYQNEDNIENLTIEKVIKYFIYFHKEEIKGYCKKENIVEDKLFDYLFENAKKELAN